jgi:hypothetical protein
MEDARVEYFEYCCDGTNSSLLIKYFTNRSASASQRIIGGSMNGGLPKPGPPVNDAHLILNEGFVPEYIYGQITPVWLAYSSRCFYEKAVTHQVEPVFFRGKGVREHGIKFNSFWKLSLKVPNLPEWMCDYFDGNRYGVDQDSFVVEALNFPFDKEATNTVYSVSAWTNIGGYTLPSSWQVVRYRRNLKSKMLELESETIGALLSVRAKSTVPSFAPDIPEHTRVTDKTVGSYGGKLSKFSYLTLTGKILNEAELKASNQFQVASDAASKTAALSDRKLRKRAVIFVFAILMIGIPVVALIWRRTTARQNYK